MNKQQFIEYSEKFSKDIHETTLKKNNDYTGGSDDPFANFRMCEDLGLCSSEVGVLIRMLDKFARMVSVARGSILQVKDETIRDTSADMANYSKIFAAIVESRKAAAQGTVDHDATLWSARNADDIERLLQRKA